MNLTIASLNDSVICVSIPIKNDLFIEAPLETFSVMLNSNDPNVVIDHGVASISIEDDDCKLDRILIFGKMELC